MSLNVKHLAIIASHLLLPCMRVEDCLSEVIIISNFNGLHFFVLGVFEIVFFFFLTVRLSVELPIERLPLYVELLLLIALLSLEANFAFLLRVVSLLGL